MKRILILICLIYAVGYSQISVYRIPSVPNITGLQDSLNLKLNAANGTATGLTNFDSIRLGGANGWKLDGWKLDVGTTLRFMSGVSQYASMTTNTFASYFTSNYFANKVSLGGTSYISKLSVVGAVADTLNSLQTNLVPLFNVTSSDINTVRNTLAQAIDTSSLFFGVTRVTGKPHFQLTGLSGNINFQVDTGGVVKSTVGFRSTTAGGYMQADEFAGNSVRDMRIYPAFTGGYGVKVGFRNNIYMTDEGGYAILVRNTSGSQINKGYAVSPDTNTTEDTAHVLLTGTSAMDCMGVAYANIANGAYGYIVVSGYADVYCSNSATAGQVAIASPTNAGQIDGATGDPTSLHWKEIGHIIRNRTGAGLTRAVLHFN